MKVDTSPWFLKNRLDLREFLFRDPDILAVFQDERPAEIMGRKVVRIGAHKAAQGAAENGDEHVHLPLLGKIPCRRHHELARDRDDRALHGHQEKNAGIAERPDGYEQPVYQCMHIC